MLIPELLDCGATPRKKMASLALCLASLARVFPSLVRSPFRQHYARLIRQYLLGAAEINALDRLNEREQVSADAASVALVEFLGGVHIKTWRALFVKRAEPDVLRADFP